MFEPFVAIGQILPGAGFFQVQAGAERPFGRELAENEAFWRLTLGRSFSHGRRSASARARLRLDPPQARP